MACRLLLVVLLAVVACSVPAAEPALPGDLMLHDEAAIREAVREQREQHERQNHERIRQLRQDLRREVGDQNTASGSGRERSTVPEGGRATGQVAWSDRQQPRLQRLSPEERTRLREDVREVWHDRSSAKRR